MILNTKITLEQYLKMGGAQHKLVVSELSFLQGNDKDLEVIEAKKLHGLDIYELTYRDSKGRRGTIDLEPEWIFIEIDVNITLTENYL